MGINKKVEKRKNKFIARNSTSSLDIDKKFFLPHIICNLLDSKTLLRAYSCLRGLSPQFLRKNY